MPSSPAKIPEERALTDDERALVVWLLHHGQPGASVFASQACSARVAARCGCGCASLDFALEGDPGGHAPPGIAVFAEFCWRADQGGLCGVFVFARGPHLAGIEVWSIDGVETPRRLPAPRELRAFEATTAG